MRVFHDTWLIFSRYVMITVRNPVWMLIGLAQPIVYLALFAPMLDRIAKTPGFPPGGALNVFVPGLIIQLSLFGAAFVGFGLIAEIRAGVVERLRVTPASRVAMLFGRALRDVLMLTVQAIILMLLAVPFGLSITIGAALIALLVLALVGLVMAPLSYTIAMWLKSEDALAPFLNAVALPLLLLSGILLPMTLAPKWLQIVAAINPLSHAVTALRAVVRGDYANPEVYIGVGVMAVLAVISLVVAGRFFGRAQS